VVLCGFEIWSLTHREEHRLKVLENGAEENIWTKEGSNDRKVEKTA
jgi:hypothetical protein